MTQTTQTPDPWFGAIAHTELGTSDPEATTDFLRTVFGLQFETTPGPGGAPYHMAYTEGQPSCGVRPVMPQEPGPSQTPYFNVEDLDATIQAATDAGAQVFLPKTAVPGQGWMAWIGIPGGNTIAAWQQDDGAA